MYFSFLPFSSFHSCLTKESSAGVCTAAQLCRKRHIQHLPPANIFPAQTIPLHQTEPIQH